MRLNRIEFALINNSIRALLQRRFEARRLLRMGGALSGGAALEIGCGRGIGMEIILDMFRAESVDGFDLDPRMIDRAVQRLRPHARRTRLWVGDATAIPVADCSYDSVFDFGIIHHVPNWRYAVAEVQRVLKPGGRFYADEVLQAMICHPIVRRVLEHPQQDRFDRASFASALVDAGLECPESNELWGSFAWFVAKKPSRH